MGPLDLLTPEPAPLFGGPPARNAYVELHNLIAAAARPTEFGPADRERIGRRHGVDLASSFAAERLALYRALLDDALASGDLTGEARARLAHVADTLGLSAADLRPAHERAFAVAVEAAVADDRLSDTERALLYTLQHTLGFDPDVAGAAYDVLARRRLLDVVAGVLADGEVSPEEADEVEGLAGALSVETPADVAARLAEAAGRWRARHGPPTEVHLGIPLEAREVAYHMTTNASWRSVDGAALHTALGRLSDDRTESLAVPDSAVRGRDQFGHVVVTSRRVAFLPHEGEAENWPLAYVSRVLPFANGVVVETDGGERVLVDASDAAKSFGDALRRALGAEQTAAEPPGSALAEGAAFSGAGRWRNVDLRVLYASGAAQRALDRAETAGSRVTDEALRGRPGAGRVAAWEGMLLLEGGGRHRGVRPAAGRPPRRFLNGVLVPLTDDRAVLVDVGERADALLAALAGAHTQPEAPVEGGAHGGGAASGARWRKVLAAEARAAVRATTTWAGWWLFRRAVPPRPDAVVRALAGRSVAWAGTGGARVTDTHLVFEPTFEAAGTRRRTSLDTVEGVVVAGPIVWVRRRRAYDWLVRFASEADAARVARRVRAGR